MEEHIEYLLPVHFCQISFRCYRERNQKCLSQSEAIFVFRSCDKLGRGFEVIISCHVFSNLFVKFRSAVAEKKPEITQPIRCHGGHLYDFLVLTSCQVSSNSASRRLVDGQTDGRKAFHLDFNSN